MWVWNYNTHKLFMDNDEEIRFRVQSELFVDTMPTAPDGSPAGPATDASRKAAAEGHRVAPYSILVTRPSRSCSWSPGPVWNSGGSVSPPRARERAVPPLTGLYQSGRPGPSQLVAELLEHRAGPRRTCTFCKNDPRACGGPPSWIDCSDGY